MVDLTIVQKNDNLIHVLHVDDDSSFLQVSKLVMTDIDNKLEIDSANSADEATVKLNNKSYDVIISDFEMPNKTGLDFLRGLRDKNNPIAFILFTGKGREEVAIQALNLGADSYMDKHGNPETVFKELTINIHQLYEKTQTKKLLWESEERFRLITENIQDGISLTDMNGVFTYTSPSLERIYGYNSGELIGKNAFEMIHPDDLANIVQKIQQTLLEGKEISNFEVRSRNKNGAYIWIENSAKMINDEKGDIGIVVVSRNIDERKKTEKALKESEERYRMITQNIQDVVSVADSNAVFTYASPSVKSMFGYTPEELIGKKVFDFIHPDDLSTVILPNFQKITLGQTFPAFEVRSRTKDGNYIWIENNFNAIKDATGEIRFVVVSRYIGERKKAEQALRESEERYSKLSMAAFEGILISSDGIILDANAQFLQSHQYQLSEILGKNAEILVAPQSREQVKKNMLSGFEAPYEFIGLRKDGTTFPIEVRAKCINYKGYHARVSAVQDITERKKYEEQLLIFSSLFELANEAIYVSDLEGNIVYFNELTYKQAGYSREEMAKLSLFEYCSPEAAKLVKSRIKKIVKNKSAIFESEHMRKDKTVFPVEVSSRLIESNGTPLLLNVAIDISEHKKAQQALIRNMEDRLKYEKNLAIVNEKLRVVGQLTRHDVRNKLTLINASTYIIKKKHPNDTELLQDAARIESAVNLSNRLLEFTKLYESMGVEEQVVVDVKMCFDEAVGLIPNLNNLKLFNKTHGLTAVADSLLKQVFYNLIDNSLKHGKKVTKIKLYHKKRADNIQLYYEDNGVGVSIEDKKKLFHEGFTTANGTGLGLWLVKKVLDVYGWSIKEIGVPSKGVKFEITIPISK